MESPCVKDAFCALPDAIQSCKYDLETMRRAGSQLYLGRKELVSPPFFCEPGGTANKGKWMGKLSLLLARLMA